MVDVSATSWLVVIVFLAIREVGFELGRGKERGERTPWLRQRQRQME